ncbi:MAG: hypothetical protein ACE5JP_15565 [Candidatus Bipolaricaulia bacterium]
MDCAVCGGEVVEQEIIRELRMDNDRYLVPVRVGICQVCSEIHYPQETQERLTKLRNQIKHGEVDREAVGQVYRIVEAGTEAEGMTSELLTLYEKRKGEGYMSLEAFVNQTLAGQFGDFSRETVLNFLSQVETTMLKNIEQKVKESPHLDQMQEGMITDVREMVKRLIDRVKGSEEKEGVL